MHIANDLQTRQRGLVSGSGEVSERAVSISEGTMGAESWWCCSYSDLRLLVDSNSGSDSDFGCDVTLHLPGQTISPEHDKIARN